MPLSNKHNVNIKAMSQQRGMTFISLIIVLAIVAFFAIILMTLFPIYMENFNLSSHLGRMEKDQELFNMTDGEIRSSLFKRLDVDDVDSVYEEDVEVVREGGTITIYVDYEVREPLFGNIDLVAMFKESAVIKR